MRRKLLLVIFPPEAEAVTLFISVHRARATVPFGRRSDSFRCSGLFFLPRFTSFSWCLLRKSLVSPLEKNFFKFLRPALPFFVFFTPPTFVPFAHAFENEECWVKDASSFSRGECNGVPLNFPESGGIGSRTPPLCNPSPPPPLVYEYPHRFLVPLRCMSSPPPPPQGFPSSRCGVLFFTPLL